MHTICLSISLLTACGPKNGHSNEQPKFDERDAAAVEDAVLKSFRNSNVTATIRGTGIAFNLASLNDVNRIAHYANLHNKGQTAANFGIYLSDLKYLIAYDRRDEIIRYFDACLRLSDNTGIKKEFSQAVELRFDDITAGDEGLETKIRQQIKDATNTSKGEAFRNMHASALAGYYIEELYHLVTTLQTYKPDNASNQVFFNLLSTLLDQKDELNNLISYFDHLQMKPEGISAYQELLRIQMMYLSMDRVALLKEKDPSRVLQREELTDIFNAIVSIRGNIVNF
ncbi:MAG: hypothetical protein OEV74_07675 [Cyclobacteriaceae bacterium]|nr:hypothetical protein [Cyclobacteriaceae bacterium]MDH4296138.1 hypothetical protein [Cyclobacteriaceae bacterium]MDH5248339.1 hypothetical protein [Cyclobacteriaceae bacterium]